ncbi:FKBP-type peptidyl-prolyl cis-trans isomerase N-terminal domain-containing protein [uncultured Klebsiella sp.]|uniref:FKBP-type peptidyl-prolyl cis-trans isomerase N-terminal domain-containing protein n=1 Tax=uncultured Klebsiella sp. TaxID=284011 RepID=UPI0028061AE6|nr:FKBP-type peptidyl-prolyl cis-trans isomerase N-terminal domain-containing protein [uncultured Klebsiella sp.]
MRCHKGKLNIYDLSSLAIVFALSALFVMLPARAEEGGFLDSISKLEIKNSPPVDAGSGESISVNQEKKNSGKNTTQKQDVTRNKATQYNKTKTENTINILRKQNAELSAAATAAQKKLDETTRTLSAQIAELKSQRAPNEGGQKTNIDALTKKNAELATAAETAQKKLDETTRTLSAQIAELKSQRAQSEGGQKADIDALTKKNAGLAAAAKTAQKKLDETTRTLSAQIAELKSQRAQSEGRQKADIDALTKKNAELATAAETAQKKLDETTRTLSAQIAELKSQRAQSEGRQKADIDALTKKNAELATAAETAQKKYDASVAALTDKNTQLQSALDKLSTKEKDINLADKSNKNAYALGVFYLTQALSEMHKMADNNVKLTPSALVAGFNDAYNKKLKIKDDEIENIIKNLNEQMSLKYVDLEKKIMAKIKNKKYEILPNGVYFVIDKKGKQKYKPDETLSMNILEKKLDGTPILNTMNSNMVYNKKIDPLMEKILSAGLKGGTVTLYGQAGSLYSTTPEDIAPDTLISITFELLPQAR